MLNFLKLFGGGRKSEAGGIKLNDAVYLLHDPGPQPDVELVFIHGLRFTEDKDAYWTTWLTRDDTGRTCWPSTWLQRAEDFPVAARVLSLNYDSSAKKSATEGRFDLDLLGASLLQQMYLQDAKIGQYNCPVVFVCHSLGGIVAQRIVLTAKYKFARDEKAQNLLRNLKGFFFYATPHSGAKLFDELCKVPAARNGPLLKCLEELEIWTQRLNSQFEKMKSSDKYKDEWKFFVAAESCATMLYGREMDTVKDASAMHMGIDDSVEIPNADHFTVCQPESKDSISFQSLKAFVEGFHRDFPPNGSETTIMASPAGEDPVPSYRVSSRDLKSGSLLGKGLSSIVYETKWNGKRCARKDFLRVQSDIFEKEAVVLVRLEVHPNVLQTYCWTVDKRSCSLVLEFMDGDLWNLAQKRKDLQRKMQSGSGSDQSPQKSQLIPLQEFIEERKKFAPVGTCESRKSPTVYPFHMREVIQINLGIAAGMKFLHDNKVAHGDLKPRNILVTLRRSGTSKYSLDQNLAIGQVKVADFGLIETKTKTKTKGMTSVSFEARKLEMVRWKAPELVDDLSFLNSFDDLAKADVYSFAVTCSQILTGEEPYPGLDRNELDRNELVKLRPECPEQLSELIRSCRNREKTKRPTFDCILNVLEKIQQGLPAEGANIMGHTRAGPSTERNTKRSDVGAGLSTERGIKLSDAVYSLHEPEELPEVEIVLIHGLELGDSKDAYWTSWLVRDGSQDNCWPMTWLARKFPKARILSISYEIDALKSFKSGTMDLYALGESLVQEMVLPQIGIGKNGCPVVFVCHCLGGLIVKQIMVIAHSKFKELSWNTKAFFFYGTPHGVPKLVDLIGGMANQIPDLVASRLVNYLETMKKQIGRLNSEFQKEALEKKWKLCIVAGTQHLPKPCCVMHVDADHFYICKPKSERDTNFILLSGCIAEVVEDHKSNQAKSLGLPRLVVEGNDKLSELCKKLETNPIIGLVGMGGIGKTTLSKIFYNSEKQSYERACYLDGVKSSHGNIIDFQKQLLQELCHERWNDDEDAKGLLQKIQQCIISKKVLVVIDDVGMEKDLKDLHVLAFKNNTSGSKLVITCRNRAILKGHVSEGEMIEVDGLNDEQAMELFSHYAFDAFDTTYEMDSKARDKFEDQAMHIVKACAGLPLSIEVIGKYLQTQNHLPEKERMDIWRKTLTRLEAADATEGRHNYDEKLWARLKSSYDDLGVLEKHLFLDFACILCDMEVKARDTIIRIWNSEPGLQNLIDCSLLKVVGEKSRGRNFKSTLLEQMEQMPNMCSIKEVLVMHNQLRCLGRWIVRNSGTKNFQKPMSYIWEKGEIQKVFENNEDSRTLEGLSLVKVENLWPYRDEEVQAFMPKRLKSQTIRQCPEMQYPKMRLLNLSSSGLDVVDHWLKKCAITPNLMKWLCLDETKINKSHFKTVRTFKGLQVLQMRDCKELLELPASIGELTSLLELSLMGCTWLKRMPNDIGKLEKLQVLMLKGCIDLKELPASIGDLSQLLELHLSGCKSLISLPKMGNMELLKLLDLSHCEKLEEIPVEVGRLTKLESLDIKECTSLKSFKSLGNLCSLRRLDLDGCRELSVPNFPQCLGQLSQLQYLNLMRCDKMAVEVAETLREGCLRTDYLEYLYLSAFPETALPLCPGLKFLALRKEPPKELEELKELKELPESFGESLGNMRQLQGLVLWGFRVPESFCESLGNLVQLQVLRMVDFRVPKSLGNLTQLQELYLEKTTMLPDSLRKLVGLKLLRVVGPSSKRVPEHVGYLLALQTLELEDSEELVELTSSLDHLSQRGSSELLDCQKLERLPESPAGLPLVSSFKIGSFSKLQWEKSAFLDFILKFGSLEQDSEIVSSGPTDTAVAN